MASDQKRVIVIVTSRVLEIGCDSSYEQYAKTSAILPWFTLAAHSVSSEAVGEHHYDNDDEISSRFHPGHLCFFGWDRIDQSGASSEPFLLPRVFRCFAL